MGRGTRGGDIVLFAAPSLATQSSQALPQARWNPGSVVLTFIFYWGFYKLLQSSCVLRGGHMGGLPSMGGRDRMC